MYDWGGKWTCGEIYRRRMQWAVTVLTRLLYGGQPRSPGPQSGGPLSGSPLPSVDRTSDWFRSEDPVISPGGGGGWGEGGLVAR
uniref:Uncharacterized protein n=1 Tax=Knipowitschia caucasica TaxID=637954 RepID=A0AAV2L8D7_KNICA